MPGSIDTTNKFVIALHGDEVMALRPLPRRFTPEDALLLAAYLVAMSMRGRAEFLQVLDAVESA